MRLVRVRRVELDGIAGGKLAIEYDNVGEPFREGVLLTLTDKSELSGQLAGVLLAQADVVKLRDALNALLGV